jgi:hypothetical protein
MEKFQLSFRLAVCFALAATSARSENVSLTGLLTLKCPDVVKYHDLLEQKETGKGDEAVIAVLEAYLGGMNSVYYFSPNRSAVVDLEGAPYPTPELRLLAFLDSCSKMQDDPAWIAVMFMHLLMQKTQSQ